MVLPLMEELSGVFTKLLFHDLLNTVAHSTYSKYISMQHIRYLGIFKTQSTTSMCNTQYLSKDENVKLYEKICEISTGSHFSIFFWQYSNCNFSFMSVKPTKQRYCTIFPTLGTSNSFKKKAASDENTSLPEPLIHLDDTARNGFQ